MASQFHIVYPRGDSSKLAVVEIVDALDYELNDYAVASRNSFDTWEEARDYAKSLAAAHEKDYVPDPIKDKQDYLD